MLCSVSGLLFLLATPSWAALPLGSLKTVAVPEPRNLNQFLRANRLGQNGVDPQARAAAIALGKALFWDQAVGSDGQACASCHFNAGADSRTFNQVDPGLRAIPPDPFFSKNAAGNARLGPNYQLAKGDFTAGLFDRADVNDLLSSQGVFDHTFVSVGPGACPPDQPNLHHCDSGSPGLPFAQGGAADIFLTGRNVEPRQTPTTINAVFNFRNFWDGRARNEFNGATPIGDLDPTARVFLNVQGFSVPTMLSGNFRLEDSSLASQAVGPPLSDMEMSYRGRTFPELGRKMLALPNALPDQLVAKTDGVLGKYSNAPGKGTLVKYADLVKAAFQDRWWSATRPVVLPTASGAKSFSQMEANFSLFWGIAVQMYEATLVADDSLFDRAFDAGDPRTCSFDPLATANRCVPAWTPQLKLGLAVFEGKGKCANCHGGPETTNASVQNVDAEKLERMIMGNGGAAVYDNGFYNTAVRRCKGNIAGACDDLGLGATIGPVGLPLSMVRFFQLALRFDPNVLDVCAQNPPVCAIPPVHEIPPAALGPNERVAVDGAFKTPGLRNIALQAPYFHNGGELSLADVVEFYDRGGNFANFNIDNLDPDIEPLGLTDEESAALVAIMESMTDRRVQFQQAPFDHPQLFVPNLGEVAAVGAAGSPPLKTFAANLAP